MDSKIGETKVRYQQIFESIDTSQRKSKIVCTLGPACWDVDMLVKMLDAGMNVARLDFSGGDQKTHGECLENLGLARQQRPEKHCAVMLDTKGPEIATGYMRDGKAAALVTGQNLKIVSDMAIEGDATKIACTYKALPQTVSVGSIIYIGGGALTCEVTETHDDFIMVQCKNDFMMRDKLRMNLPGAIIAADTMTEKDIDDVTEFGLKNTTQVVDYVCASFVRKATDIEMIRGILGAAGQNVKIIAKIQNHEGLHNYDEILAEADGVLIARGDLALEIPPEKVFIAQKWMIEKANLLGKPVMIANQMLESMNKSARPTRAEASDVANAILDGVDCAVLGDETATGDYPINAVSILAKCCVEAEKTIDYRKTFNDLKLYSPAPFGTAESVAQSAVSSVLDLKIDQIIVITETGKLARLVSKFKPEVGVFVCTCQDFVVRQLQANRGIQSHLISDGPDLIATAVSEAKKQKVCKVGHKIVVVHSLNEESGEESNVMKIVNIE